MLSRVKGYSDDAERAFLSASIFVFCHDVLALPHAGKNLINILSMLGETYDHFAHHALSQKDDHPNGPGAEAYLKLNTFEISCMNFRKVLESRLKAKWPCQITVDGASRQDLHLGANATAEINARLRMRSTI